MAHRPPALEDDTTRGWQEEDCAESLSLPPSLPPSLPIYHLFTKEARGMCWTHTTLHLCVDQPRSLHTHAPTCRHLCVHTWGLGFPSRPLGVTCSCSHCALCVCVRVRSLLPRQLSQGWREDRTLSPWLPAQGEELPPLQDTNEGQEVCKSSRRCSHCSPVLIDLITPISDSWCY